jgi:hypothetical protein
MFQENVSRGEHARTVSPTPLILDEQLPALLREQVQRLQFILPIISVSALALRRQNAELDEDIASVLHQHASDPLGLEIETLQEFLEVLPARCRKGVST